MTMQLMTFCFACLQRCLRLTQEQQCQLVEACNRFRRCFMPILSRIVQIVARMQAPVAAAESIASWLAAHQQLDDHKTELQSESEDCTLGEVMCHISSRIMEAQPSCRVSWLN